MTVVKKSVKKNSFGVILLEGTQFIFAKDRVEERSFLSCILYLLLRGLIPVVTSTTVSSRSRNSPVPPIDEGDSYEGEYV